MENNRNIQEKNRTEREKMLAGAWYDANFDTELLQLRQTADELCFAFSHTAPSCADSDRRQRLLKKLMPQLEENTTILAPLYMDYGIYTHIGAGSFVNHGCYFMDGGTIEIGKECFIGPFCGFYTAGHALDPGQRVQGLEQARPIVLKDRVWLGASVIILPGVTIGEGAVIGAGSVVTRNIPPMVVAAGNPCRVLRPVSEADRISDETADQNGKAAEI